MSYPESVIQGVNCRLGNKKYRAVICQPDIFLTLCAIDADIAVNCSALSGFVFMFQSYDYFSSEWLKKMESTHASCLGHFHAYQTISKRSTTSTIVANI